MEDKVRENTKIEKKKLDKPVEKVEEKVASSEKPKEEGKPAEKKPETKKETEKKDEKPAEPIVKGKFKEAVVNGRDLRISTKHAVAISNFIRGKDVDVAIKELEEVAAMRKAIPMKGEIPHRKGMMSGRYPVKAVKEFIILLKGLRANAIYHDLELEKLKIYAMANVAARPQKRFGQARFKRTHVQVKLIPRVKVGKSGEKK